MRMLPTFRRQQLPLLPPLSSPLLLLLLLLLLHATFSTAHEGAHEYSCIHNHLVATSQAPKVEPAYGSAAQRRSGAAESATAATAAGLRITLDTSMLGTMAGADCTAAGTTVTVSGASYACTAADVLTAAKKEYLVARLLPAAVQFWTRALRPLVPVQSGLFFSRTQTCGGVALPAALAKSPGLPNADIVVFVTSHPIVSEGVSTTLAYAGPCWVDSDGRPLAGYINFAPSSLNSDTSFYSVQLSVAIHEMAHILGFSPSLWDIVATRPLTVAYSPWTGKSTSLVTSPKVKAAVALQTGCATALGGELEDSGGTGSVGSHWEKRLNPNDFMASTVARKSVYSAQSLALFEDLGVYAVNYSVANTTSLYGLNAGCDFLTKPCSAWTAPGYKLCAAQGDVCTLGREGYGPCVQKYTACITPAWARYYSDCTLGGVFNSDYCSVPYLAEPYNNRICTDSTQSSSGRGETFGANSLCFVADSTLSGWILGTTGKQPGCFAANCSRSGSLFITIAGNKAYECPKAGGDVTITGNAAGVITCPPATEVCPPGDACSVAPCANGGTCALTSSGGFSCTCPAAFSGTTCGVANPCAVNPCLNSGTCSSSAGVFTCKCTAAFMGSRCGDVNACAVNPCLNSGTCSAGAGGTFTCQCPLGFLGTKCGDVNACAVNPCLNSGTCSAGAGGTFTCQCPLGFSGTKCGDVNPCAVNPCLNSGTCSVSAGVFTCKCPAAFMGSRCGDVNACAVNPCLNSGTCSAGAGGTFTCQCPLGFSGTKCDVMNLCATSPCLNGGTCVTTVGGFYTCQCPSFYSGQNCQTDACTPNPCLRGGTCSRAVAGAARVYACTCPSGWTGTTCNDVDRCVPSPCLNGGTCTNGATAAVCTCPAGVTGSTCSTITCVAQCSGKNCGSDGCGGLCGSCTATQQCSSAGVCRQVCQPLCLGRECGDNGCGGVCGTCAEGFICSQDQTCQKYGLDDWYPAQGVQTDENWFMVAGLYAWDDFLVVHAGTTDDILAWSGAPLNGTMATVSSYLRPIREDARFGLFLRVRAGAGVGFVYTPRVGFMFVVIGSSPEQQGPIAYTWTIYVWKTMRVTATGNSVQLYIDSVAVGPAFVYAAPNSALGSDAALAAYSGVLFKRVAAVSLTTLRIRFLSCGPSSAVLISLIRTLGLRVGLSVLNDCRARRKGAHGEEHADEGTTFLAEFSDLSSLSPTSLAAQLQELLASHGAIVEAVLSPQRHELTMHS